MKKIALVLIAFVLVSCQKKNETPETLSPDLASYEQKSASDSSNVTSAQNSAPIIMNNSAPVAPQSNTVSVNQPNHNCPGHESSTRTTRTCMQCCRWSSITEIIIFYT